MNSIEKDKIYKGNCLDLMKKIEDKSIDMICVDFPYGTTKCQWDVIIPFDEMWEQYERIIRDDGAIVLFGVEPFSSLLRISNLKHYRYDWYWDKKRGANFAQANKRPLKNIETICVFSKKQSMYFPIKTLNPNGVENRSKYKPSKQKEAHIGQVAMRHEFANTGSSYEADKLLPKCLIEFSKDSKPIFPTQKPIPLLEYLIKTYTLEDMTVLDSCIGSGGTCIACVNTNRKFIGMELKNEHYELAKNRINNHIIENNLQDKYNIEGD